jgi:putative tryptophan/tyrosine transport system substrate-binding protein
MRRREFVTFVGSVAAWPMVAWGQNRLRRVAVLTNVADSDADERLRLAVFHQTLQKLGWIENTNVRIEYRWSGANTDLMRKFATELVAIDPDVIFVIGTTTVSTVLQQTSSIPTVFITGTDPVQAGFVKSMAKPAGNATGFVDFEDTVGSKWLELLNELVPNLACVIFLHADSRASLIQLPAVQRLAAEIKVQFLPIKIATAADINAALENYSREASSMGLIVPPSSVVAVHRNLIIARAAQYGLPAIYSNRRYTVDGGLMSYGVDRVEEYRRAASYVDRILRGAKASDLPVRRQERLELLINLKTARALGLEIPRLLLARASEVID